EPEIRGILVVLIMAMCLIYGEQGQGSGRMPAFGGVYTETQLTSIIEYVRGL
ncbi:MAG: cytochrome c, partial [Ilumatobacteraceae bacterium]|nr:cytochrome c [Ilumatobacteraceae bacterium]